MARPAATVDPTLGGVWRWRERHVLRFEPSGGFAPATAYTVSLIPERILAEGQGLAGNGELEVRIDQFLVEGVEIWEEPEAEGDAVVLDSLVDVGLGYLRLGQPSTTVSGGEAQRVKLATELSKRATGRTVYILDEPTTGLHFEDVRKLLGVLQRLVDAGNTVLVVEHDPQVMLAADRILVTAPPRELRDISITVSRLTDRELGGERIFMDVQCAQFTEGRELCRGPLVGAIRDGFRARLTGSALAKTGE